MDNSPSVVLARQPIFDRQFELYAYELLFRADPTHLNAEIKTPISPDIATSRVISHAFVDIGIDRVIGNNLAFVNLTRQFLLNQDPMPFTQDKVVVEVLEDIEVDDEIIAGVKQLAEQGYTIALDDFTYDEKWLPLIEIADIIKIDLLVLDEDEIQEQVDKLKPFKAKLLAEKVENHSQYQQCLDLGFDYFQGHFFSHPEIIEDKPIPDNKINLLQIINKLHNPDVEIEDIENIISQDANLSFKLLRLLNSAAFNLPRKIESIKQGLVMLGLKAIRSWTNLILMSELNTGTPELISNTLVRAKMAELLAKDYSTAPESGFMVGLFSSIDAMLSKTMQEAVSSLPITDEIKQALTERKGTMGELLETVIHYEKGEWSALENAKVSLDNLSKSYIEATEWSLEAQQAL